MISADRLDYSNALAVTANEQALMNLVRLRFAEAPQFLEVSQIVGGRTQETVVRPSLNLSGLFVPHQPTETVAGASLGAEYRYTDRPTITYTPIKGEKMQRTFLTPIPPAAVLYLLQAGWPADRIMQLTLQSINGLRNRATSLGRSRAADPSFERLLELFRQAQDAGGFSLRVEKQKSGDVTLLVIHKDLQAEASSAMLECRRLLGLASEQREFKVAYGNLAGDGVDIAMQTRSLLHMMLELSACVAVPESFSETGVARRVLEPAPGERLPLPMVIRCSAEKPAGAFVAVRHLDHWYYIPESDVASKGTLSFLQILTAMLESDSQQLLPLVTISTQ
ncbi:MAG: hypothetical protein L6R28_21165 [Planctomycetes bacterium]|nr:hypothetical protein [Planctomycetota bacterium]